MCIQLLLLFLNAFLSATLLPIGSEPALILMLSEFNNWQVILTVATLGNVAGSCINYVLGWWGRDRIVQKWFRISEQQLSSARNRFEKWGSWSLLFAWLPVIGDPLTVIAGVLKISPAFFLIAVSTGKLLRYLTVAAFVLQW